MAVSGPVPVGEWEALTGTDSGPTFCLSARSRVHLPKLVSLWGWRRDLPRGQRLGAKRHPTMEAFCSVLDSMFSERHEGNSDEGSLKSCHVEKRWEKWDRLARRRVMGVTNTVVPCPKWEEMLDSLLPEGRGHRSPHGLWLSSSSYCHFFL